MVKEIEVGDKKVTFKSSGALPIVYRELVQRDFFEDMQQIGNGSDRILDMAWCMYRHANAEDKTEECEWLGQFEFMDINNVLPDIMSMLADDSKKLSEAKKKNGK